MTPTLMELEKQSKQIQHLSSTRYQMEQSSEEIQAYFQLDTKIKELESQLRQNIIDVATSTVEWETNLRERESMIKAQIEYLNDVYLKKG